MFGMARMRGAFRTALTLAVSLAASAGSPALAQAPDQRLGRDLLRELIEIDTTHEHGSTTKAAEAMARRLRDAGFPAADVQVIGPSGSAQREPGGAPPRRRGRTSRSSCWPISTWWRRTRRTGRSTRSS